MVNNNPLNIRYSKNNVWLGQIGQNKGFVKFFSIGYGVRAAIILLVNYYQKYHLDTIEKIVSRFAPSSENDTQAYISFVSLRTHFARDRKLVISDILFHVLPAMSAFESNYYLPVGFIEQVIARHNIKISPTHGKFITDKNGNQHFKNS